MRGPLPERTMQPPTRSLRTRTFATALVVCLAACGGGGGGSEETPPPAPPPPPPPPATNQAPQPSFTAPASLVSGQALALDASASADPEGQPLAFRWSFGDGTLGAGARIAKVYAAPGRYTLRLTVDDGNGGVSHLERSVDVTAAASAAATVQTLAVVRDIAGQPLPGVTVAATVPTPGVPGSPSATTGADGRATLATGTGVAVVLKFSKPGYADQWRNAALPAGADSGYVQVTMQPRESPLTLADAAAGGTLVGRDGARLVLPAGALVDAAGNPVSGPVSVAMTPVDVGTNTAAFPGRFAGTRPTGEQGLILSNGTVEYALSAAGNPVQLAPGRKATIEIPIYAALARNGSELRVGDSSPLWTLDEKSGGWVEEGAGTVVDSASSPSGLALRAEVGHFSWWNHDEWAGPSAKPKPRCLVDTNADGVLEDLTGTGHCWHAGTGPEQPDTGASQGSGVLAADRKRAFRMGVLAEARTRRLPAFAAYDSTPVGGGKVLEIPADASVTFRSYAKNGTLFGMTVVRLGAGVEQEVPMLLAPVQGNPGTMAITLPYDDNFLLTQAGELDEFTFDAEAGVEYELSVDAAPGALIAGSSTVIGPNGNTLAAGSFANGAGFLSTLPAGAAGTVRVRVSAAANLPGSYRLRVRRLAANGGCASPAPLTLDAAALGPVAIGPNSVNCWSLTLAAGDVVQIANQLATNIGGSIVLRAPNGDALASDGHGNGSFDGMLLRLGVVNAGTYRVEVTNNRNVSGTLQGLQATRLAASAVASGGSLVLSNVNGTGAVTRHVVLQTDGSATPVALVTQGNTAYTVYPGAANTTAGNSAEALAIAPAAGMWPVVEFRSAGSNITTPVTVSLAALSPLALDTDQAGTAPAPGGVAAFAFAGQAGSELSWDFVSSGNTAATSARVRITAPSGRGTGGELARGSTVTLPETGLYTVAVHNEAGNTATPSYTLRVNTVPADETPAFGDTAVVDSTLALGQVRRYNFGVTQAQLFSARLTRPSGSVLASAQTLDNNPPLALSDVTAGGPLVAPRYATATGITRVTVRTGALARGSTMAQAAGPFRLTLQRPPPAARALGDLLGFTIAPETMQTFGYTVAAGAHRLCVANDGPLSGTTALLAVVQGPSAPPAGYGTSGSDLTPVRTGSQALHASALRSGAHTLAFVNPGGSAVNVSAKLVPNPEPLPLAFGTAATGSAAYCTGAYHSFPGVLATGYTLTLNAAFNGRLRLYKQLSASNWLSNANTVAGWDVAVVSGTPLVLPVTIPANGFNGPLGSGTYVVAVEPDPGSTGSYTLTITQP